MNNNLITKTQAINEYFLKQDELNNIQGIQKKNPHHKSTLMTLYNLDDIYKFLKTKYNTNAKDIIDDKLDELRKEKKLRSQVRQLTIKNKKDKRKHELCNELKKYNLVLREDSKLCQGYINGTIKDKDIKWIANRMCQVKYLFDYCNIREEIEKVKQQRYVSREFFRYEYNDYAPFDEAEENILERIGGYPNKFPWIG